MTTGKLRLWCLCRDPRHDTLALMLACYRLRDSSIPYPKCEEIDYNEKRN